MEGGCGTRPTSFCGTPPPLTAYHSARPPPRPSPRPGNGPDDRSTSRSSCCPLWVDQPARAPRRMAVNQPARVRFQGGSGWEFSECQQPLCCRARSPKRLQGFPIDLHNGPLKFRKFLLYFRVRLGLPGRGRLGLPVALSRPAAEHFLGPVSGLLAPARWRQSARQKSAPAARPIAARGSSPRRAVHCPWSAPGQCRQRSPPSRPRQRETRE